MNARTTTTRPVRRTAAPVGRPLAATRAQAARLLAAAYERRPAPGDLFDHGLLDRLTTPLTRIRE